MDEDTPDLNGSAARASLVHREIIQLIILIAIAVSGFFLTRSLAANNRALSVRDAGEWYERGERQMASGDITQSLDSFRRAAAIKRADKTYVLALARALAANGQSQPAIEALEAIRATRPEDTDINLQLARLAAGRGDMELAVRFYQSALYAPWPAGQLNQRRLVRIELIQLLLKHGDASRAASELLASATEAPTDPAALNEIGRLFVAAGNDRRALEQFTRALELAPGDERATAAAGAAAFRLGDYALARQHLLAVRNPDESQQRMREVADAIVQNDPMAPRLPAAERQRRLIDGFRYASDRFVACLGNAPEAAASQTPLLQEARDFSRRLRPPAIREAETIDQGLTLIYRLEAEIGRRCPPSTPRDEAFVAIARLHGADVQ